MKYLILIIILSISCSVKAQFQTDSLKLYNPNFQSIFPKASMYYFEHSATSYIIDNSVLKLPSPVLAYNGNNNDFDIYQSTPDNLYVIKPDSTLIFNMPVQKSIILNEPIK